jgi:hypothetical protein
MVVVAIIDAGPARRLIPWCSALIHIRGKPATNPLAGIYRNNLHLRSMYLALVGKKVQAASSWVFLVTLLRTMKLGAGIQTLLSTLY